MKSWKSTFVLLLASSGQALADEDAASFWTPGQFASFAAVAPEQGFSLPVQSYFYAGLADGNLDRTESTSYAFEPQYFGKFFSPT